MPLGLIRFQDIFKKKIDQTYGKCKGAVGIADDIEMYGNDIHMTSIYLKPRKELEEQVLN